MTTDRYIRPQYDQMLNVAERHYPEHATLYDLELDSVDDIDEALDLYRTSVRILRAAEQVRKATGERLAQLLGEGGAACYGTQIVRYKLGYTEKCVDPDNAVEALTRMVREDTVSLRTLINPNQLKKTGMPQAFRDTFYIKKENDEPSLTDIPIDKAPKFLRDMTDGDIRIKANTEEDTA